MTIPMSSTSSSTTLMDEVTYGDSAPSRQEILQRAAARPPRPTWASIVLAPTDPILGEKMKPRVVERRARFRKIVQGAVGACLAFCVAATAATALSSKDSTTASGSTAKPHVPSAGVVLVEKLDLATRTKAPSHVTAAIRPSSIVKKRR